MRIRMTLAPVLGGGKTGTHIVVRYTTEIINYFVTIVFYVPVLCTYVPFPYMYL